MMDCTYLSMGLKNIKEIRVWDPDAKEKGALKIKRKYSGNDNSTLQGGMSNSGLYDLSIVQHYDMNMLRKGFKSLSGESLPITASKGRVCVEVDGHRKTINVGYTGICGVFSNIIINLANGNQQEGGFSLTLRVGPNKESMDDLEDMLKKLWGID